MQSALNSRKRMPTLFIPHGGGPCFFMDWSPMGPEDTWNKMAAWLRGIDHSIGIRPKAVLVISAHWEEEQCTLLNHPRPPLLFDYYGFPKHTYDLKYDAPGAPELAEEVRNRLIQAGIPAGMNSKRGFDHGVFIPFKLIYPEADLPILQLSLIRTLDPATHLQIGRALAPLRDQGVLIVGSGLSYHNLRDLFDGSAGKASDDFDHWLTQAVCDPDPESRNQKLLDWEKAPQARKAHPREEHLLPLFVVAGAAQNDPAKRIFHDRVMGASTSAYRFG